MARGGSRPGAGRPRLSDEEKAKKAEVRKAKRKAASKPAKPKKMGSRKRSTKATPAPEAFSQNGVKSASAPADWPFGTLPPQADPPAEPKAEAADEMVIPGGEPLEFLQAVINETRLKLTVRMQAAAIAAPFKHAKPAPLGKKEQRQEAAKETASRFKSTTAPPRLVHSTR